MRFLATATALVALSGCQGAQMSPFEAIEAMQRTVEVTRGALAIGAPVVVTRSVQGLDAPPEVAAQALAAGWQSMAPCATVAASGTVVDVDLGGGCTVDGHTLGGRLAIDVIDCEGPDYAMGYLSQGLSVDGLMLDGDAAADWTDETTHVAYDAAWDGLDVVGELTVDEVPGLGDGPTGMTLAGAMDWTRGGEPWSADLDGVRMRHGASLPESGTFFVTNPAGRTLELDFQQVDKGSVQISATGMMFPLTWVADL